MRFKADCVDLYLGTRWISCHSDVGQSEHVAESSCWQVDGIAEAFSVLEERVLPRVGRRVVRVWLSGGLARPFAFDIQPGMSTVEANRVATALATERTGFEGRCQVWLEQPVKQAGARIAVAIQTEVLEGLIARFEGARMTKLRLQSVSPWWADVLRGAMSSQKQMQLLAVRDCDSVIVLSGNDATFESAEALSPVQDGQMAEAVLARKLVATDVNPAAVVRVHLRRDMNLADGSDHVPDSWMRDVAMARMVGLGL